MMDREEAIWHLKRCKKRIPLMNTLGELCKSKTIESIDMAISALKAPTAEDAICAIRKQISFTKDKIKDGHDGEFEHGIIRGCQYSIRLIREIKALPSAEQVTGKLNNPCDSLLKADSESCKEQKSKLDLISRADAIEAVKEEIRFYEETTKDQQEEFDEGFICGMHRAKTRIRELPSADKPTELLDDGTLKVNVNNGAEVNRVLV